MLRFGLQLLGAASALATAIGTVPSVTPIAGIPSEQPVIAQANGLMWLAGCPEERKCARDDYSELRDAV
jgi:hypothetical protein